MRQKLRDLFVRYAIWLLKDDWHRIGASEISEGGVVLPEVLVRHDVWDGWHILTYETAVLRFVASQVRRTSRWVDHHVVVSTLADIGMSILEVESCLQSLVDRRRLKVRNDHSDLQSVFTQYTVV